MARRAAHSRNIRVQHRRLSDALDQRSLRLDTAPRRHPGARPIFGRVFLDPNPDARVEVLAGCLTPGAAPKYAPTTGADYLRERLVATYGHPTDSA